MYWTRLKAAVLGRDILCCKCNDQPVRDAQYAEAMDLLPMIPMEIPGSGRFTGPENLAWLLLRCMRERDTFPVDKTGRWIGFVHGVLAMADFLDVNEVRERTRDRFHAAYLATGQIIPETLERPSGE